MKKLKLSQLIYHRISISILVLIFLTQTIACGYFSITLDKNRLQTKRGNMMKEITEEKDLLHVYEEGNNSTNSHSEKIQNLISDKKVAAVPVENYFDVQYYGNVYIGSNYQELSVIFDTGSNILWVASEKCSSCRNFTEKLDPKDSTTLRMLDDAKNITYAIGYVNGSLVEDNVYISREIISSSVDNGNTPRTTYEYSMGVERLKFLLVDDEKYLDGTIADGVLGLGIDFEGDPQNSFVNMLYKQEKITSPKFSFYLTDSKKGSRLYMGDITENPDLGFLFKHMSQCDLHNKSRYWMCEINGIEVSAPLNSDNMIDSSTGSVDTTNSTFSSNSTLPTKSTNTTLIQSTSKVIFDTGTSYLIVPALDFIQLVPHFTRYALNQKCGITPMLQFVCQCRSPKDFQDVVLYFPSKDGSTSTKFVINSENMIEFYPTTSFQCRFEILVDIFMMDAWILGDSVLRDSLLTFDMKSRQVGWVQDIDTVTNDYIMGEIAKSNVEDVNPQTSSNLWWYLLALVIVLTLSFLVVKMAYSYSHQVNASSNVNPVPLIDNNVNRQTI